MQYAMERIGGRWKITILWYVHNGVNRFSSLKSRIEPITPKMLAQQLQQLEEDGLLTRIVLRDKPIHIEYRLTERGIRLIPVLTALNAWAVEEQTFAANGDCGGD
jgi:DNA-binding HxlR family transcriptional regulator